MSRTFVLTALLLLAAFDTWCGVPESEYRERRARLVASADTNAAFVFGAPGARMRTGDVNFPFRQESNLLYLTGVTEGGLSLIVVPHGVEVDGKRWSILLFCPASSAEALRSAAVLSEGIVLSADRFAGIFSAMVAGVRTLYVSAPDIAFVNDWLNGRPLFLEQDSRKQLQQKYPGLKVKNAGPLVA